MTAEHDNHAKREMHECSSYQNGVDDDVWANQGHHQVAKVEPMGEQFDHALSFRHQHEARCSWVGVMRTVMEPCEDGVERLRVVLPEAHGKRARKSQKVQM